MFFSTNPGLFHSPKKCQLDNNVDVFYDNTALDCSCLAQIRADPDFAGAGIIAAFLFVGWLTILVAAVPAFYSIMRAWKKSKSPRRIVQFLGYIIKLDTDGRPHDGQPPSPALPAGDQDRSRDSMVTSISDGIGDSKRVSLPPSTLRRPPIQDPEPFICSFASSFLQPLCDIQIVTGVAMLVSALAQLPRTTFYHEQFAVQFWWMTLNSFWVSRIDYSRNTPEMRTWRAHARRVSIWFSVVLSVVAQSIIAVREHSRWDPITSGRCYVGSGTGSSFGQNLFWLAGTCIYALVLSISLFEPSRRWFDDRVNARLEPSILRMRSWARNSRAEKMRIKQDLTSPNRMWRLVIQDIKTLYYSLAWVVWWILVHFLSIWCAGNTSPTVELVTYSIFAGFLTWWIIFLKVQNLELIKGNEDRFTFGQVLPLILLVIIMFNSLDVWGTLKRDRARRKEKNDEEARGIVSGQ
jgi:hypothetical protein